MRQASASGGSGSPRPNDRTSCSAAASSASGDDAHAVTIARGDHGAGVRVSRVACSTSASAAASAAHTSPASRPMATSAAASAGPAAAEASPRPRSPPSRTPPAAGRRERARRRLAAPRWTFAVHGAPTPPVGHHRERRGRRHLGERGGDVRARDDELEHRRPASDHAVIARHRGHGGVGDQDARACHRCRARGRAPSTAPPSTPARWTRARRPRCCTTIVVDCDAAASPTALAGTSSPSSIVRVAIMPSPSRSGVRYALRDLPEGDIHDAQLVGGHRLADDDRPIRREDGRRLAGGCHDEPHAGDGGDDQEDADEESCVAPERAAPDGMRMRHASHGRRGRAGGPDVIHSPECPGADPLPPPP